MENKPEITGLARALKAVGQMIVQDDEGNNTVWVWDYVNDKAVIKSKKGKPKQPKNE